MSDKTPNTENTPVVNLEEAVTRFNRDFVLGAGAATAVAGALWMIVRKIRTSASNDTIAVFVSDDVIDTDTSTE